MRQLVELLARNRRKNNCLPVANQPTARNTGNSSLKVECLEERAQPSGGPVTLGTAANFAVLGMDETWIINSGATVVNGDEGVSRFGLVDNQRGATINGNVQESNKHEYMGRGTLTGTVNTNSGLLKQADQDARTASAAAAALSPTQTFRSINRATTITGNGSLNVVNVNGDVNASLTLSGGANDVFIINVRGDLNLGSGQSITLSGGVTANNVLFNFVGGRGSVTARSGSVINGTLLALHRDVELGGTVNGEVIAGGEVDLRGHATINQCSFTGTGGGGGGGTIGITGTVFNDVNGNGVFDAGDTGMQNVVVELTGTDVNGNPVDVFATSDSNGVYTFTGLTAGTYSMQRVAPANFFNGGDTVGTVNGVTDGTIQDDGSIGAIVYAANGQGAGYNFAELPQNNT
jgi:hypothetical protein